MNRYQITGIIYIHIGMNEWVKRMRIYTQNIACSQRQMNTCHTSFSYILWTYGEHIMNKWSSRTSDQFIWLVSEKKTEAVNAYLIKNSKGEGEVGEGGGKKKRKRKKEKKKKEKKGGGGGGFGRQSEGLSGVVWVYKIGLKWPVIAMAITRQPQSLSLSERGRELELEL